MQNKQQETPQQSPEKKIHPALRYTSMATQMAITILLGVWGGRKLDETFALSFPAFTLCLSLLGVAVAIYMVIKDLIKKK